MNYYDVFGISPTATTEDINAAHKALAKTYHPDINSSEDAHEKMAMLNEAHAVLSDSTKREMYDDELKRNREILSSQAAKAERSREFAESEERAGKAELLRRKAEARLKSDDAVQKHRMEQAKRRTEETARKHRQAKAESDKKDLIKGLSALVMDDSVKRHKRMDVDEERYYATKVLLSMVRKDDKHLRRMAEEADRKQRIDEILSLVKELNDKKDSK